jgi:hypothetical protein
MSTWSSKNLGDALLADGERSRIEDSFRSAFAEAGSPNEMALFIRHESEGRLHCEVKLYLSPASLVMARQIGATPCEPPSSDGLGLLVGSEDAWHALFPDHSPRR